MNQPSRQAQCPVTGHQGQRPVNRGPKVWPVIGYTVKWLRDPLLATLRVQRDHGEVVWLRLTGRPAVQVTSAEAIRRIMVTNADNYRRGKYHVGLREWMGEGLITLDGERWKEHRRVLQPAFTAHSLTQQLEHLVYGVRKQLDKWAGLAGSGAPADLVDEMNELVSRAFGMALINRDLDKDLIRAVAIASESVYRRSVGMEVVPWFIPTPYNRRKRWAHRKLDSVAAEIVAARAAGDDREDIAGLLLRSGLPSKAFRDNLRTVFLAGADTTAMGLAWAVWELAAHPEIRDQVEREVDEVIGDRVPTEQDLDALPVTRAVIDETLRLHPPIWVMPRSANDADVIDGRPIRKHTSVLMPFFAIQRSPRHWPDPDSFDHRRFQGSTDVRRAGAYLPFGAGKHQCIGKELALTTLVLALAMLSRRFRVAIDGAQPVRQKAFTTLQPDPGMRVTISERVRSEAEPAGERVHP